MYENIKRTVKQVFLNKKYICKKACAWTSAVFAFIGLMGTFVSLSNILPSTLTIWKRLLISSAVLAAVWVICFVIISIIVFMKQKEEIMDVGNNHHVYVEYGDVFSPQIAENAERRNLVISVNRCFDTKIGGGLVSENTLHGKTLKKLYEDRIYTEHSLNTAINDALQQRGAKLEVVEATDKPKGKKQRYPAGEVAEIKGEQGITYFFVALSEFDRDLSAQTSDEEYVHALIKLLIFCKARAQGDPVIMPLIGGGGANTGKDERTILEYLVKLVKLNKHLINYDLHIVVRESGKDKISILGL